MRLLALWLHVQTALFASRRQFGDKQGHARALIDAANRKAPKAVVLSTRKALVQVAAANSGRVVCVISNAAVAPVLGMHLVCAIILLPGK